MPSLKRYGAAPLLRTVGGKRHASDEDHEEQAQKRRPNTHTKSTNEQEEIDINAEPESSGDEQIRLPPPPRAKVSKPIVLTQSSQEDTELKTPRTQSGRQKSTIRAPRTGAFARGQADKAKRDINDDKENAMSTQSSLNASDDNVWEFGEEFRSQAKPSKGPKFTFSSKKKITNLHQVPTSRKVGSGSVKGVSKNNSRKLGAKPHTSKANARSKTEDQSDSEVSMKSQEPMNVDELDEMLESDVEALEDPELRSIDTKKRPKESGQSSSMNNYRFEDDCATDYQLADPELRTASTKALSKRNDTKPESSTLSQEEIDGLLKRPPILDQLGNWKQDQPIPSSQPESSAPQDDLDNLQDYIQQLPDQDTETTHCTLCKESVDLELYWSFWKGTSHTVKNHTAFCLTHKRRTALGDYHREGYPSITWDALPSRIRKHRMSLYHILTNTRPSPHRTRYEPLALTGKAAAVPKRRADLPPEVQDSLTASSLDDPSTYPGYYGPRGRRAITETVMRLLKNEIKNSIDPVVQSSGAATFVQAVLVPETAVLLIMEDCEVDWERAEEIREATYEMGVLLNEEIEDVVEVEGCGDSDEENEYREV